MNSETTHHIIRAAAGGDKFTQITNQAARDGSISYKARGILLYVIGQAPGWKSSVEAIEKGSSKDGRTSVLAGLKELREAGYVHYRRYQNSKGFWVSEWIVSDDPALTAHEASRRTLGTSTPKTDVKPLVDPQFGFQTEDPALDINTLVDPQFGFPTAENPTAENPTAENPTVNTKYVKTKHVKDLPSAASLPEGEPTREDVVILCKLLATAIEANGSKRPTITQTWKREARLLLDRDQRPIKEIRYLIGWATQDSFWQANILSMASFRKKYDTLRLQAKADWQKTHGTLDPRWHTPTTTQRVQDFHDHAQNWLNARREAGVTS